MTITTIIAITDIITIMKINEWGHFFSYLQHGTQGIIFLTSDGPAENFSKFSIHISRYLKIMYAEIVVEWHQGHIWFESLENKATTFYIELP